MFLKNIQSANNADIQLVSLSNQLCSQTERLRARLQESIDNGDLSSAIKIAETSVGNDAIVALLAMVQCVERDVKNEFRPIVTIRKAGEDNDDDDENAHAANALALNNMADVALLTLTDLYTVAESFLKSHGWFAFDQSSNVSGGIVYEKEDSGERSEEPEIANMTWQMKLMLSIPVLIQPGCVDGKVVWAADVVHYQRLLHTTEEEEQYMQQFNLECDHYDDEPSSSSISTEGGGTGGTPSCISVIDVLKSDEDGQSARLRGTYHGCWRGLYAEAVGEMDMSKKIGRDLESWTDTTLAGLSVSNDNQKSARILVIGLASGQLVSFLQRHTPNAQLQVVEASSAAVDIAVRYYHLHPSVLDCVSITDPLEYVKSQCLDVRGGGDYDTIIVNVCSSEDTFPTLLMNDIFFKGLMSMLSNHPSATLLVHSGVSADDIVTLVGGACKHMHGHRHGHMLVFREYFLRDHADRSNNEGVIVAARRREWSLSSEDWCRGHMGEHAQSSGAMAVADAQQTEVVRLEKFLSLEDIELIHKVAKAELASLGEVTEGPLQVHTDSWRVLYLQNNNIFQQKLPDLRQRILEAVRQVDKNNWCLFDKVDHWNIRVVEYHRMDEFGELADPKHYDLNSLLTMDIMLSEEGAFEGGDLQTEEADGILKKHEFKQGDALVFVSHKYHCVGRVRSGRRNVMVLEFWYGPERQCPHRCEHFGQEICAIDPAQSSYTQQYSHLKQKTQLEQDGAPSIPLPFRLGSVFTCQEGSYEILELLWEPSGGDEVAPDKPVSVNKEVTAEAGSDPFACFGDSSDSDDDE